MREVREETGYEAEVVDVLPGVFKGGTTTSAFFVMRHIGPPGRADWETASVRWVDFHEAEVLIGQTTNSIGRVRDLAILQAAQAWFEDGHGAGPETKGGGCDRPGGAGVDGGLQRRLVKY